MLDPYNSDMNYPSLNSSISLTDNSNYDSVNNSNKPTISSDHYAKSRSNSSSNNVTDLNARFSSVSSKYNDDPRFASVGSEPYTYTEDDSIRGDGKIDTIKNILSTAYDKTKTVASTVGETMSEMELGDKLKTTGTKTYEVLKTTSSFLYEKGNELYVKFNFF